MESSTSTVESQLSFFRDPDTICQPIICVREGKDESDIKGVYKVRNEGTAVKRVWVLDCGS